MPRPTKCADCNGRAHADEGYTNLDNETICCGCHEELCFHIHLVAVAAVSETTRQEAADGGPQ